MYISITEKPFSQAEIENKREAINAEIVQCSKKKNAWLKLSGIVVSLFVASWVVAGLVLDIDDFMDKAMNYAILPITYAFLCSLAVAVFFEVTASLWGIRNQFTLLASMIASALFAYAYITTLSIDISAGNSIPVRLDVMGIYIFLILLAIFHVGTKIVLSEIKVNDLRDQLGSLAYLDFKDFDADKCLDIKEWLEDEDIRAFRDAVVEQGRPQFIRAEYYAMHDHWESRSERLRKQQAEEACKEIFLGGIMQDKA